jgi:CPA1 family monovalent cation:H+ antiporter
MDRFQVIGILITLTAVYCYINHRWLRLPVTIGVMLIALGLSLLVNFIWSLGFTFEMRRIELWLRSIDFNKAVLHGMLSYLLFAGALQLNLSDLFEHKVAVGFLATVGVLLSTFFVGSLLWIVLQWIGVDLSYAYCMVFGALISPTDAIAVLGALKNARVPKRLELTITGEALFNDGVAIVAFIVLMGLAAGTHTMSLESVGVLFVREAAGGLLFGLCIGYLAHLMMRTADNAQIGVIITLAVVTGGYALADALECSGPIAIAVAGLIIGNLGRREGMSATTQASLNVFWELIDHLYNALLFALLGLESLLMTFTTEYLLAGFLTIPLVLLARFLSIGIPAALLKPYHFYTQGSVHIMTWGGLRGGVSVALALSLPLGQARNVILTITYIVVVFSILVQGLTMERMVKQILHDRTSAAA